MGNNTIHLDPLIDIKSEKSDFYNIRMSNFLEFENKECKTPSLPSRGENGKFVLRWKTQSNGEIISNSRFIEWSDATIQIVIGNKVFNVTNENIPRKAFVFASNKNKFYKNILFPIEKQLIIKK